MEIWVEEHPQLSTDSYVFLFRQVKAVAPPKSLGDTGHDSDVTDCRDVQK